MELKTETLEAKLVEYRQAAEQHRAIAREHEAHAAANDGAAQAVEELLAVAKAPAPSKAPPK